MPRAGHLIVITAFALLVIGAIMVTSAGMVVGAREPITLQSVLLSRQTIYLAAAVLAMAATIYLAPIRLLANWAGATAPDPLTGEIAGQPRNGWRLWPMWAVVLALLAFLAVVYIPGVGDPRKGAHRWMQLPIRDLTFQPSEAAKWLLIVIMAWYVVAMGPAIRKFFTGLVPGLAVIAVICGFIAIEDLGTAALLASVAVLLLIAGGARFWHFLLMVPPAAAAFAGLVIAEPYRVTRLTTFLRPFENPTGSGYHVIQSMIAVANGEVFGRGLGHGLQKFDYLPEDTTDFLFAIICEELGLVGAGVVIILYVVMLWAGMAIIRKQTTLLLKLIGLGIVSTVGIQAVINIGVVTGMLPTKGIALPLLSSGGSGWILTAAALGVLVAMDRLAEYDRSLAQTPHLPGPPQSLPGPEPTATPTATPTASSTSGGSPAMAVIAPTTAPAQPA